MKQLLTLAIGLITVFASAAPVPAQQTVDALIKELIAQAKTDTERATTLYGAVSAAEGNAKLQIALLEKAAQYGIASRSAKGFDAAAKSLASLVEKAPDRKNDWKAKEIELYRAWYYLTRDRQEKARLGRNLVAGLLESATLCEQDRRWQKAAAAYLQAGSVAAFLKLDNRADIQLKQRRAAYLARVQQNVARHKETLAKDPKNTPVRTKLLAALVTDLDNPAEASKHLSEDVDQTWRRHVPLAAQAVDKLKVQACRTLGDWYYRQLFQMAGPFTKINMLVRAKTYYELFLARHTAADTQTFQVKVLVAQVEKELKKYDRPKSKPIGTVAQQVGVAVRPGHACQLWRILPEFAKGTSYRVSIKHAAPGADGAFYITAWEDKDGNGTPDNRIGISKLLTVRSKDGWSSWTFQTKAKAVFVGNCWKQRPMVYYQAVKPRPKGYVGLSDNIHYAREFGGPPNNTTGPRYTNIRVEVTKP